MSGLVQFHKHPLELTLWVGLSVADMDADLATACGIYRDRKLLCKMVFANPPQYLKSVLVPPCRSPGPFANVLPVHSANWWCLRGVSILAWKIRSWSSGRAQMKT